jgi:hypothetical protein
MQDDAQMGMGQVAMNEISNLIQRCPVTTKERQEIMPYIDRDNTDLSKS